MAKEKQTRGLVESFRIYLIIPAIAFTIFLISTIVLVTVYVFTAKEIFMIIYDIITVSLIAAYLVFFFRVTARLRNTFQKQLFDTTYTNLSKIRGNDTNLLPYGDTDIKEIKMLDKATKDIKAKLESSYLLVTSPDYSNIELEYVDKERNLVTYKSFRENIGNIIFVSQSFRNLLLEVYFALPGGVTLNDDNKERLLNLYNETFKEHVNTLYMFSEDERSLLIYIPVIDSFSEIKDKLNRVVTSSSIMVRDDRGIQNILAQYALVAYPYSSEDMIFGDLHYAKRQNSPYFLFIPTRYRSNVGKKFLINNTMNLNYTSKMMNELSKLDYSLTDNDKNEKILKSIFNSISNFLNCDDMGLIMYDEAKDNFYSYLHNDRATLFLSHPVKKSVIELFASVTDEDNYYYFSQRSHANQAIQQILGLYGVESGEYYSFHDFEESGKVIGMLYLFNRNKNMILESYLREAFFLIALRIENYFEKRQISDYADSKHTENENILALADMFTYHIDDEHNVTYASRGLQKLFHNLEVGKKCYYAFFGHDHRCPDCPLLLKKKKYFEARKNTYEVSMTLADRKDNDHTILIRHIAKDEVVGDLYNDDYLTYSYKALVNSIRDQYVTAARGYVVLLLVDNAAEIIEKNGSEGFGYLIRDYVRNLKNKLGIYDVYYYDPSTIAIHFPYIGHKDLITKLEAIYPLSKMEYYNNEEFSILNITYLPVGYPRGFARADDFMRHVSDFYHEPTIERNKDFIYFADYSIARSASKRAFMVSVLEQEFSGLNSTSMNLQPIVSVRDGHIFGAEILLRINDAHRNVFFNAEEISRIAEEEHKTHIITESIINFIGALYKEYGNNIFLINKFNRIAINIDQTYLNERKLLSKLIVLCEENHLPAGFISMEIPEDVVPTHKERIKELASELSRYKIRFSCDRYVGTYVPIEELSFLGFNEVKVARDIILTIDKDPVKYNEMKEIVAKSKKNKISVAAVGVEIEQQFKMLKELDEDMMVQGYYLYKPLTRSDLITALISYEKK